MELIIVSISRTLSGNPCQPCEEQGRQSATDHFYIISLNCFPLYTMDNYCEACEPHVACQALTGGSQYSCSSSKWTGGTIKVIDNTFN